VGEGSRKRRAVTITNAILFQVFREPLRPCLARARSYATHNRMS
jgi:hypothetical protein